MTIHAIDKNMFIKNVVVDYRDRVEGSVSKLNTFSDGFKVIKTIIRLFKDYKPLRFFTTIALVLFVLALIFFVPVMGTYVNTGLVPNFPTLIVCGFVVIAALQCFSRVLHFPLLWLRIDRILNLRELLLKKI